MTVGERRVTSVAARHRVGAWRYVLATVLLLLAAFGLRVWALGTADLTFDEVATYYVAHRPLLDVVRYVMGASREHPPAYYLLMSLWMRWVGASEFAVRYPSVLIGVLAVSWSYKLGRRLLGRRGGWWGAVLCAIVPFSIWAGRTGRMYALVLLLSVLVMERWLRWIERPDGSHWLGFVGVSLIAAMTHYYLALLWAVQALLLLLLPRETRAVRKPWVLTLVAIGAFVGIFVAVSPGIRAMLLETASRFPYRGFRGLDVGIVLTDFYVWGFRPELLWTGLAGVALTALGWGMAVRRNRLTGALLAVWGIVPLVLVYFVPERLETRYLTPVFPAFVLGLAVLLAHARGRVLQLLAVGGLLGFAVWRVPPLYENLDISFSTRIATLHAAAAPGDALMMNGPWPALLLEYYRPPEYLTVYKVPSAAPPGFSEDVDVPRLAQIVRDHRRVWVSYGAIHWADPAYSVSRWLAENTYRTFERAGLVLYLAPPELMSPVSADVDLGSRLDLRAARVDRQQARVGDVVHVQLDVEGHNLDRYIGLALGVVDAQGSVWQQDVFRLGPVYQPNDSLLPDRWRVRQGVWLLPGLPPGRYTLGLQVEGAGIDVSAAATHHGWIPLSPLDIAAGAAAENMDRLLPNYAGVTATFGDSLSLIGVQPTGASFMQGYPVGFHLWWRALAPTAATQLHVRLTGPESWEAGVFSLGSDVYPPGIWQTGDVVRQSLSFQLPDDLPAGTYWVQVQVQADAGDVLTVQDVVQSSDYRQPPRGEWLAVFPVKVEARTRHYAPPLFYTRQDVRFGDVLRLRGYRLERKDVYPGDSVRLTVYWQALQPPDQIYAAFNHLRKPDSSMAWQGDSWPQAGIYTTDHWRQNEVVTEEYMLVVPDDLPPGEYPLYTGVYEAMTGDRLPAVARHGERLLNDEVVLFVLKVSSRKSK